MKWPRSSLARLLECPKWAISFNHTLIDSRASSLKLMCNHSHGRSSELNWTWKSMRISLGISSITGLLSPSGYWSTIVIMSLYYMLSSLFLKRPTAMMITDWTLLLAFMNQCHLSTLWRLSLIGGCMQRHLYLFPLNTCCYQRGSPPQRSCKTCIQGVSKTFTSRMVKQCTKKMA